MNFRLFRQTWFVHWKSLFSWTLVGVLMNLIEISIYPTVRKSGKSFEQFFNAYPEALRKLFRMENFTTGPGFLNTELFSLMIPMVVIGVGLAWGSSATAEDEENGSADLLFTLPISRLRILTTRFIGMISALATVAFFSWITLVLGALAIDMNISFWNVASAMFTNFMLGIVFGSIALFSGVLLSKRTVALGTGAGIALLFYIFYSIEALVDKFKFVRHFNPIEWSIVAGDVTKGIDWFANFKLFLLGALFMGLALVRFMTKDIRSN